MYENHAEVFLRPALAISAGNGPAHYPCLFASFCLFAYSVNIRTGKGLQLSAQYSKHNDRSENHCLLSLRKGPPYKLLKG